MWDKATFGDQADVDPRLQRGRSWTLELEQSGSGSRHHCNRSGRSHRLTRTSALCFLSLKDETGAQECTAPNRFILSEKNNNKLNQYSVHKVSHSTLSWPRAFWQTHSHFTTKPKTAFIHNNTKTFYKHHWNRDWFTKKTLKDKYTYLRKIITN